MTNFHFLSRVQPVLSKGSANERREKKVSMANFRFLSRVQPVLSKESTAGNRPPGRFGGVTDTDCERLPGSGRSLHAHPSARLRANGLQTHQRRRPTAATSRPHVGGFLCTRLATKGAITLPRPTAASWTRSGHRSYPTARSPHNVRHRPIRPRRQSVTAAGS